MVNSRIDTMNLADWSREQLEETVRQLYCYQEKCGGYPPFPIAISSDDPAVDKWAKDPASVLVYFESCGWQQVFRESETRYSNGDTWENFDGEQPTHWLPMPPYFG